jgi:hypothetical protein
MLSKVIILVAFWFIIFGLIACEKKEKKENALPMVEISTSNAVVTSDTTVEKEPTVVEAPSTKSDKVNNNLKTKIAQTKPVDKKSVAAPKNYKIYSNLKQLLKSIGLGETKTKQELIDSKVVPEDALKIVKSVTKVSENELAITWKSSWLVEKISDVKLKNEKIKVELKNGLVYTSGNAIGIRYNGKIYYDLIIKGDKAYIPSVKKYSWRIGK